MQTPIPPEALTAATASSEIAAVTSNTASKLASLSSNVATPALQQAASLGPPSPVISTANHPNRWNDGGNKNIRSSSLPHC